MRVPTGLAAVACAAAAHLLPPCSRCPLPAAVVAAAAEEGKEEGGMGRTLTLGLLFGLWYLFNIQFNMRVPGGVGAGALLGQLATEGRASCCCMQHYHTRRTYLQRVPQSIACLAAS